MTRTVANVKARVRSILKDTVAPLRYADVDVLNAVNDALVEVRRVRPDLFIAKNFVVKELLLDTDKLPIEDAFFNSVVFYTAAYMMLRDDEFSVDGRANSLINKATAQLLAAAA